ncbi:MAG: nuclear transport factor 2 family protein [Trebonia sp.]
MVNATESELRSYAVNWFAALDRHVDVEALLPLLADQELEMRFPEGVQKGHAGFREWYRTVTSRFFDEAHELKQFAVTRSDSAGAEVRLVVNWQAKIWDPPEPRSISIGFDASQTWELQGSPATGDLKMTRYIVDALDPMAGSPPLPTPRGSVTVDVVQRYYQLANDGDWAGWTDLFADDQVMDEQLAGHVEGREALREMMIGFPAMYTSFQNIPRHIVAQGDQAAAVSHISATTPSGRSIEAEVANYYRVTNGRIAYMANFHDTAPFKEA